MTLYYVPITIVEYGRSVLVKADSVAEARFKAKTGDWVECTDPERHQVKVVAHGKVERVGGPTDGQAK